MREETQASDNGHNPIVSVIVPNYNYGRYLRKRTQSILSQTYQDYEIILLDDCSTDDSLQIMESYRSHPKVSHIVVNETNSGSPCSQWEKGLALASGKYAWIAEADDLADPNFLGACVDVLEQNPKVNWVKTMSNLIDADGNPSNHAQIENFTEDGSVRRYNGMDYISSRMLGINPCYNASMTVFRTDAWRNIQDRDYRKLRYVGDWLFWGSMAAYGEVAEIRSKLNLFRLHGQSVTDEGNAGKKTKRRAEDFFVKDSLARILEKDFRPLPDMFKYRMLRDLVHKDDKNLISVLESEYPETLRRWRCIPTITYRLLWLKVHIPGFHR